MAVDMEQLVRVYINMRKALKVANKAHKKFETDLKAKQQLIAMQILKFLNDTNQLNARVNGGTAYKQMDILPTGENWEEFYEFVSDNDAFEFLEKRIVKSAVKKYMEDNDGAVPPGVRVLQKVIVKVVARDAAGKELSEDEEGE